MIPLLIALASIGAALILPKLLRLLRNWRAEKARLADEAKLQEKAKKKVAEASKEAERTRKIKAIDQKGGLLAKELHKVPTIPVGQLQILYIAATQRDIHLDLATEQLIRVVPYPTAKIDYVQINDVSQLPQVSPDQMVLDEDLFYQRFVTQDLMRPEYYDVVETFKRLYILLDVSRSMWDPVEQSKMPNSADLRDTWARGIVAGLLVDAIEGRAEYLLRPFSDTLCQLHSAINPTQAAELLSWIVSRCDRGNGTDIGKAVEVAVTDIRTRQTNDIRLNHILLLTDGLDQAGLTRERLVALLGSDVKLHVVLIGASWPDEHPLSPYVIAKY